MTFRVARDEYGWSVSVKPEKGARVTGHNRVCPWATLLAIAGLAAELAQESACGT